MENAEGPGKLERVGMSPGMVVVGDLFREGLPFWSNCGLEAGAIFLPVKHVEAWGLSD